MAGQGVLNGHSTKVLPSHRSTEQMHSRSDQKPYVTNKTHNAVNQKDTNVSLGLQRLKYMVFSCTSNDPRHPP